MNKGKGGEKLKWKTIQTKDAQPYFNYHNHSNEEKIKEIQVTCECSV